MSGSGLCGSGGRCCAGQAVSWIRKFRLVFNGALDHVLPPSRQKLFVEPSSIQFYARSFERAFFCHRAAQRSGIACQSTPIVGSSPLFPCRRVGESRHVFKIVLEVSRMGPTLFLPFRSDNAFPAPAGDRAIRSLMPIFRSGLREFRNSRQKVLAGFWEGTSVLPFSPIFTRPFLHFVCRQSTSSCARAAAR